MIILIVSIYRDGEIKSIKGYTTDEKAANTYVKKLNNTLGETDYYSYTTKIVDKII